MGFVHLLGNMLCKNADIQSKDADAALLAEVNDNYPSLRWQMES